MRWKEREGQDKGDEDIRIVSSVEYERVQYFAFNGLGG